MEYKPIKIKRVKAKSEAMLGKRFGKLVITEILGVGPEGGVWVKCKCDCGNTIELSKTRLTRKNNTLQCKKCGHALSGEKHSKKFLTDKKSHIGEVYGDLTILDVFGSNKNDRQLFAKCKCSCGKETTPRLSPVLTGKITSCGHETRSNLFAKDFAIGGTSLTAIDGRRKTNKNNKTGYTGVSLTKKGYRAYIHFKRKMYDLGTYKTIEEAVAARKEAEEELFGKFLEEVPEDIKTRLKNTKKGMVK